MHEGLGFRVWGQVHVGLGFRVWGQVHEGLVVLLWRAVHAWVYAGDGCGVGDGVGGFGPLLLHFLTCLPVLHLGGDLGKFLGQLGKIHRNSRMSA